MVLVVGQEDGIVGGGEKLRIRGKVCNKGHLLLFHYLFFYEECIQVSLLFTTEEVTRNKTNILIFFSHSITHAWCKSFPITVMSLSLLVAWAIRPSPQERHGKKINV